MANAILRAQREVAGIDTFIPLLQTSFQSFNCAVLMDVDNVNQAMAFGRLGKVYPVTGNEGPEWEHGFLGLFFL